MKSMNAFAQCEESAGADVHSEAGEDGASSDFDMNSLKDKIIKR